MECCDCGASLSRCKKSAIDECEKSGQIERRPSTYLKYYVTQVLLIAIERLQQLKRLAAQREHRLDLREHHLQADVSVGVAEDRQLGR